MPSGSTTAGEAGLSGEDINELDVLLQLEKVMSDGDVQNLPNKAELEEASRAAKLAKSAQDSANQLRDKAKLVADPKERERLLKDAYEKEVEAHGQSKAARRMASGAWQGAAGGAGIGTAVGVGVGTIVGTLVGGVASIPTTGLGALVGSGVGAVHGPWIKLGGEREGDDDDGDEKHAGPAGQGKPPEDMSEDEQHQAVVDAAAHAESLEESTSRDGDR